MRQFFEAYQGDAIVSPLVRQLPRTHNLIIHQGLNRLVAIELKVGRFEPECLGKLSFYLEALDRVEKVCVP